MLKGSVSDYENRFSNSTLLRYCISDHKFYFITILTRLLFSGAVFSFAATATGPNNVVLLT